MGPSNIVVDSWRALESKKLGTTGLERTTLHSLQLPKVGREMNIEVVKVEQHVIQNYKLFK